MATNQHDTATRSVDRFRIALAIIIGVAVCLRLAVAFRYGYLRGFTGGDQDSYAANSRALLALGGLDDTWSAPGYSLFVAAARVPFAAFDWPLRLSVGITQAAVGGLTVMFTGLLGRRLHSARCGLAAAGVVALLPSLVLMTAVTLSEVVFTCLLTATMYLFVAADRPLSRRALLAGGALLGACVVTRPVAIPVAVVMIWFVARGRVPAQRLGRLPGWLLVLAPVVVMWVIWFGNNLANGEAVPLTTSAGYTLCIGNHDGADGTGEVTPICEPGLDSPAADDRARTRTAVTWMAQNPGRAASLVVQRIGVLAAEDSDMAYELAGQPPWDGLEEELVSFDRALDWIWLVTFAVGAVGVAVLLRSAATRWVVVAWLAVLAVPLLGAFAPRYHQPIAPLVAIGVGVMVSHLSNRVTRALRAPSELPNDTP